jgi:hypothetical protein
MAQKWNLQDIRPAGSSKQIAQDPVIKRPKVDISPRPKRIEEDPAFDDSDISSIDVIDGNTVKKKRVIVTSVVAVLILGLGFFTNVLMSGAEITVHPKTRDVSVQSEFIAHTEPKASDLSYELLSLDVTGEKQVKASGKEQVSSRAEGKIFVYNAKSTSPQRLIKNTRFESSNGLIYRIKESIEVPGVTKDAKGNTVPGSIVADVFADSTGEKYNIEPGKFTVPGLKDTDQYDSVYGESTTPFTGGFEGEKYIIDDTELNTAKQALHLELRDKLIARLEEEKPAGFIIFDGSYNFVYESLPSTEYGESLATIKEKVTLNVPIFKEAEFSKFIAEKTVPEYTNEEVSIIDPYTLTFSFVSATSSQDNIAEHKTIDFLLKGSTKIVWLFDEKMLKEKLISAKKTAATVVFGTFSSITHAQAEIRPFWANSFPDSPEKIKIVTVLDDYKQ